MIAGDRGRGQDAPARRGARRESAAAGGIRRGRFCGFRTRSEDVEAGNDTVIDGPDGADEHSSRKNPTRTPARRGAGW